MYRGLVIKRVALATFFFDLISWLFFIILIYKEIWTIGYMNVHTVILAAGQGSRMHSALPKALHTIAGTPMVQHVINTSKQVSNAIHVVVGHGAEAVKAAINDDTIHWALQEQQLGTGHAVLQAMPDIDADSVVLIHYGDVPLTELKTLQLLVSNVTPSNLNLMTVTLDDPAGYGRIIRNDKQEVVAIVEDKDATEQQKLINEVNTGIISVNAGLLREWLPTLSNNNAQGEYYLTDIIALAAENGCSITTVQPSSMLEVQGVNNKIQLAEIERQYQLQLAERLMNAGATIRDPRRFDCRGQLVVGQDVIIDINNVFEGEVSLGNSVVVGANCVISNSTIGDDVIIEPNSVIDQAVVGDNCQIGPFARIRPGTTLANNVKVGNFVETKKSTIGSGSKVNHLTYIGDAHIGQRTNIGAGTITCNYDGVNKSKTILGDDVFIGSNTSLVAPVTVANGGTVGAGSTITKDVAEQELAIARREQRNIKGWKRPKKKG